MTRIRQGFTLVRPSSLPLACCSSMAEARLGLNAQLHTPPLPATHVSAGTDSDTNPKASRYDYLFTRSTSLRTSDLTPRSKLSPATVLRSDRGHRVGQGSDPPFPPPGPPRDPSRSGQQPAGGSRRRAVPVNRVPGAARGGGAPSRVGICPESPVSSPTRRTVALEVVSR